MMSNSIPYIGIRPFQREDAGLFYGRREAVNALIDLLSEKHFVAVIAPSGYGKSSLIKAGLIPSLEAGILDAHINWCFADCRPGSDPFVNLAKQLLEDENFKKLYPASKDRREASIQLTKELCASRHSLNEIVDKFLSRSEYRLFLLVDQFEDIFRFHSEDKDSINNFIQLLLASSEHSNIYIVLTMRLEFLGECARFDELPEAINRSFFLVPRLTTERLQETIEAPAKQFGGTVKPSLLEKLQEEMRYHPERLPLLQHALMRMWKSVTQQAANRNNSQIELSLRDYDINGGISSLSVHAREIYDSLEDNTRNVAEIIFKQLTEKRCDSQYVRRPCRVSEMTALKDISEDIIKTVIDKFSAPESNLLRVDDAKPDWLIDISHESLISQWEQLKTWADEEARRADMYREFEKKARKWKIEKEYGNSGEDFLLTGIEWKEAVAWYEFSPSAKWTERYCSDKKNYEESFMLVEQFLSTSRKHVEVDEKTKERKRLDSSKQDLEKQKKLRSEIDSITTENNDKQCCWRWLGQFFSFRIFRRISAKKTGLDQEIK